MKRFYTFRRYLLAPLVYLAALFLLCEEWLWRHGARAMQRLAAWPPLHALEDLIRRLPPYWALVAFVLPAALLFPVKILALMAIANGQALLGLLVILLAKLGGAAAVARIYTITRPTLLTLPWFARWHGRFMTVKDRWIARLRATRAWRRVSGTAAHLNRLRTQWWQRRRTRQAHARRDAASVRSAQGRAMQYRTQPKRVLRRFVAQWRARRR